MISNQTLRIQIPRPTVFQMCKTNCKLPYISLQLDVSSYNNIPYNNIPYMSINDPNHSQK